MRKVDISYPVIGVIHIKCVWLLLVLHEQLTGVNGSWFFIFHIKCLSIFLRKKANKAKEKGRITHLNKKLSKCKANEICCSLVSEGFYYKIYYKHVRITLLQILSISVFDNSLNMTTAKGFKY